MSINQIVRNNQFNILTHIFFQVISEIRAVCFLVGNITITIL